MYHFINQLVFRSPFHSFLNNDEVKFNSILQEAIYLASPVLFSELQKFSNNELIDKKEVEKVKISLYKYTSRMSSRCTPYGLFAGCATGQWGETNNFILNPGNHKRHTRLDMSFLCAFTQHLTKHPAFMPHLIFFPNNSIYALGEQLRYVEYKYSNNKRSHQISSVDNSGYLQKILLESRKGKKTEELALLLINSEISYNEAMDFIKELIDSQLLVSELEPTVSGADFAFHLTNTLEKLNTDNTFEVIQLLHDVQRRINNIDKHIGNDISLYKEVYEILKSLGIPIEENQLFQTDLYKNSHSATLDKAIQKELLKTINFLNKLFPAMENQNLKTFKEKFHSTYAEAEMPLLDVLDTETGIGYKVKDKSGVNTLIDDVYIPINYKNYTSEILWGKSQQLLQNKLIRALKDNLYAVTFTDEEVIEFESSTDKLPDTLHIIFKVINSFTNKILLKSSGGSSAANLLGRFAHGDEKIHEIIKCITKHEKEINNDKILAEIVHLPESRTGNILSRPAFRDYEIPYLAQSLLDKEKQIDLQDLYISVRNNQIILRSKILNKEIIPRLSTAHNYSYNALPVYEFLCEMQTQYFDKAGLGFHWGITSNTCKFLPRAEYGNVILSSATWNLTKEDFESLFAKNTPSTMEYANEWRIKWNIPSKVVLAEGDNELLVDFENELSIKTFISTIKKSSAITLHEFLFSPDNALVKDESGAPYTNEIIAILLKDKKYTGNPIQKTTSNSLRVDDSSVYRNFSIGSQWLYYKIYCGVKTSDKILTEAIKPLTESLKQKGLIEKWHFIRYADPDGHIRLRFYTKETHQIGQIIKEADSFIKPFVEQGLINKIMTDTYKRELERYGVSSMELSESLFCIDSVSTLSLLDLIEGNEGEQIRWLYAVRCIDELLSNFKYSEPEKLSLLERLKTGFFKEHGGSKELKLQLDNKFRKERKNIENILAKKRNDDGDFLPLFELLQRKSEQTNQIAHKILVLKESGELNVDLDDLLSSYIHMMLNRIFMGKQRVHEMVIYDFLYRYYRSVAAKEKSKSNNSLA